MLRATSFSAFTSSEAAYASSLTASGLITVVHFGHSLLPMRTAMGEPSVSAVAQATEELDLVLLELHPRTAAVAEAPPGQGGLQVLRADLDAGGQALDHGDECGPVRLTGRQPTQHAPILPRGPPRPPTRPLRGTGLAGCARAQAIGAALRERADLDDEGDEQAEQHPGTEGDVVLARAAAQHEARDARRPPRG